MEYECDDGDWWVKTGKEHGCVSYIGVSVTIYVYDIQRARRWKAARSCGCGWCGVLMTSRDSSYVWHTCHGALHVAANLRVRMRAIAGRFVHQRSRAVAQRFIGGYEAGEMGLGGQRRRFFVVQSDDDPALIDALRLVPLLFM